MNEEKIYKVTGCQYGEFADNAGKIVHFATLFCVSEFNGEQSQSFHYKGVKAHVFKCANESVLSAVEPNQQVTLYFNQYGKVSLIKPAK